MKLNQKLILSFSLILVVFSLTIFIFAYSMINEMVNVNYQKIIQTNGELGYSLIDSKYTGEWQIKNGKLFKGDTIIDNNFNVVDEIKNTTGDLVSIFLNDTRVSTTVLNEEGKRSIGTKASGEVIDTVLIKGQVFHGETTVVGKDVVTYYRPLKNSEGRVLGMWFVGIEKTEINKDVRGIMINIGLILAFMLICGIFISCFFGNIIIETLKENEEKYRMLFNNAGDSIVVCDMGLRMLAVNKIACKRYGYTETEMISSTFNMLIKSDYNVYIKDWLAQLDENGYALFETIHECKNGTHIPTEVNAQKITWNKKPAILSICRDITDRKKAENEIIYLSYHDKLTGLYNRRFYEEEIKRLDVERNLPISIIIGDVNGLKLINDAFGHHKGDELLQKAATAIKSACRADDIVARWGGDEFVILLPKTKTEEVEEIVKRIKNSYSNEQVNALSMSISFGWSTKGKTDEDILKVLKDAEDYMYKHKIINNEGMRGNTINIIINTLHEKNPREEQHSKRVSEICQNIGKAMGLSEIEISRLKVVGLLHDIGKIAIEESILNKPGKLTEQERDEIERHPDIGYRILSSSYDMLELAGCILAHHERWDGSGYPKGLKGEAIPIIARIIAIADTYDAMTSKRPYRSALSDEEATIEIKKNSGTQFDPAIARLFVEKVLFKKWS